MPIRWDLVRVAFLLVAVRLALPVRRLPVVMRWAERLAGVGGGPNGSYEGVDLADVVRRASGYVPGADGCLVRAIVLRALLLSAGLPGQIRLGAARDENGRFRAHAWVECDGETYLLGPVPRHGYAEFSGGNGRDSTLQPDQ